MAIMNTRNSEEGNNEDGSPRTAILRQANFPPSILAVAKKNTKKRFFIPSSMNSFAGIPYPYVMIDNGCSSMLLPFPGEEALREFADDNHIWRVGGSRGTGAVNSVTLTITNSLHPTIGTMHLANNPVMELPGLRFHLSTASAQIVLNMGRVQNRTHAQKLQDFANQNHSSNERHHVLLGQTLLDTVVSVQARDAFVIAQADHVPTADEIRRVRQVLATIENPEWFDDLEDEDHDGDEADWEDCSPWNTGEFIDEPND
jgi:hypothetical protein